MKRKINWQKMLAVPMLLGLFIFAGVLEVSAVQVYGVTSSNELVRFGAGNLGTVTTVGSITGLQSGETIKGIDFRPATGQLYALGSNSRIYTINKRTGAASFVGTLTTPLNGTNFGFDFNPVADRIRIVSDTEQDLRANPNNGSNVVDGTLAYSAGDANAGVNPTITGATYINSFVNTTSTALYDVDSNLNILVTQNPANSGMLQTVGPLGFDVPDVFSIDHTAASNVAYAAWTAGGTARLYTINLMTGAATNLGAIGRDDITDITLEIGSAEGLTAYGLTDDNRVVTFSTKNPNEITNTAAVTGLQGGDTLRGIDLRPATGEIFAFGATAAGATGSLYKLDPRTGIATFVGAYDQTTLGNSFGFDFNPTVDRIRTVSDLDINRRTNPAGGATIADGTLAYGAGDVNAGANPNIVAAGYENSFGGATSTRLFDIDSDLNILAQQNPANAGTLLTVGPLTWNTSSNAGMDIIRGSNRIVAALNLIVGGSPQTRSELYEIDTVTGAAAFIAPIGINAPIISLTVSSPTALNRLDYDGNGLGSYATFRPSNNIWSILRPDGMTQTFNYGLANTDFITPADFDGDGKTDVAIWRETTGQWIYLESSTGTFKYVQFGAIGDEPVARDYTGDGKADFAVVRRINGNMVWYILNSVNFSFTAQQFGLDTDYVAPGDYDGDGRFDISVYREEDDGQGRFYVNQSTAGFTVANWGLGSDLVVPGDYDGDGKTDFAVARLGEPYVWYILRSSDGGFDAIEFGTKPQFTTQNDYDGDGKTDISTWDLTTATFSFRSSSNGSLINIPFGQNGDFPIANYDTH
jgi:hypothetical protein